MSGDGIRLELRALAYLDVLGSSELALRAADDFEALKGLFRAVRFGVAWKGIVEGEGLKADFPSKTLRISTFSDLAAASVECTPDEVFALCMRTLQHYSTAARLAVFNRGAMVVGTLAHSEDMVFGKALVDAHRMERELAIVPRVIVDPKIVEFARTGLCNYNGFGSLEDERQRAFVEARMAEVFKVDDDGLTYLNGFHAMDLRDLHIVFKEVRDRRRARPEHGNKYEWLVREVTRQISETAI